ncbi:CaiB/BaiF CoA transferase family protein [Aquamicrobium defluvii]|uniref:Crotonobetainyl-CoA:carnitine CoA-transferase CaiB-like acyl-CoA transferase n=1 Tax=Aquamicrobium defluvii TaxID=69279 RepID=A0A4R6Y3U5_9HYPH|nr:CaiB/BaiF CoA-transferase family protein [Aquamicrobium defluvii]TDR27724.1 crotonobetainyl-CoA:carnitine CoA-transferase CaiB-like acyl-CoA transferase [Aquamicrobium defluvii]
MTNDTLPLEGIRVLDLSRVLAGPWATMSLADLGAEVWKIENINGGDDTRAWSVPNYKGVSTYYLCANRGKHSIAIDLKDAQGLKIVFDLAARADVVVENFRPGTADRLGLGYDAISALNPGVIYCSISGYGQTGPERDRPGYDFIMQAESGLMSITGEVDGPPNRLGVAFTDVVAGMVATQSILAALYQRRESGKGQYIDVALLESALNMLINVGTGYLNAGVKPVRFGNAHPTVVPYQVFEASDGVFALAVGNDRMFADFCNHVLEKSDLARDPRFATAHGRAIHRQELIPGIEDLLRRKPCQHWLDACERASVPAGRVKTVSEALESPSVTERGVVQSLDHPELGPIRLIRAAHGLPAQGKAQLKPPPMLGEDTRAVLSRVLGLDDASTDRLSASGAVMCHTPGPVHADRHEGPADCQ